MIVTRVQKHARGATVSLTDPESIGVDPILVTATVLDPAGEPLGGPLPTEPDGDGYRVTLPPEATAELGRLTVTWTVDGDAAAASVVDVVGHVLFTIADARADSLIPASRVNDARLLEARSLAERQLEEACRLALARRRDVLDGQVEAEAVRLPIAQPPWSTAAMQVVAADLDGATLDQAERGRLIVHRWGQISNWARGGHARVTIEHGPEIPPARARIAALTLTKSQLLEGPIDSRSLGIAVEGGGSIGLATPGLRGARFGIPEVDEFIAEYGWPPRV